LKEQNLRLKAILVAVGLIVTTELVSAASQQTGRPLTNNDVIEMKRGGISDEVLISRIRTGPTKFAMNSADFMALKGAGVSDSVVAEMLRAGLGIQASVDLSRGAVVLDFTSAITDPAAVGLPEATQTAVMLSLRNSGMFSGVTIPERAAGNRGIIEISAELVDFAAGNMAKRMIIGLGTGRPHAGFNFSVKETATGKVLWTKTIKETASFWAGSMSSSTQRSELPDRVAKKLAEELKKAKLPGLR
jgi:hypothetical protein